MKAKEKKISELQNKIEDLRKRIALLESAKAEYDFDREVYTKIYVLENKILELQRRIRVEKGPTYTDGVLDLYLEDDSKIGSFENYNIALAGTGRFIGSIRVAYGDMRDNIFGNIGYKLSRKFRGNGYMLQALEILRGPMIHKGLERPIITVEPDNKPSVRTIEKFGGKKVDDSNWYDTYEVDLKEKTSKSK